MNTGMISETGDILGDIAGGLTDFELMRKHCLSPQELRETLRELVSRRVLTPRKAFLRPIFYDQTLDGETRRTVPREYLLVLIPVYEVQHPEAKGWLTDISEAGCGVQGISVNPGHRIRVAIDPSELSQGKPIVFDALCCWSVTNVPGADPVAGLEIINIDQLDNERLKDLVRFVALSSE